MEIYIIAFVIIVAALVVFMMNSKIKILKAELKTVDSKLSEKDSHYQELIREKELSFTKELSSKEDFFAKELAAKEAQFNKDLTAKEVQFDKDLASKDEFYAKEIASKDTLFEKELSTKEALYKKEIEAIKTTFEEKTAAANKLNEEQVKRFEEITIKLKEQINNASDQMLKERQKEFSESSRTTIDNILKPLKESMGEMKKAMEESTSKQDKHSGELSENVKRVIELNNEVKKSADNLTNAFLHKSKIQGNWGEIVLDELLQNQGLVEGIHYDAQATLHGSEGNRLQPDIILHLDKTRELVIDSKVSLKAFFDYVNCEDELQKEAFLKEHINSLKRHIDELSKKDYSSYIQAPKTKIDYVIMFVPHTQALWTALNKETDLWRNAMEKAVYIADEQSLYAAIRIIHLTWRQIEQAQNHEKVYKLAEDMINRVGQYYNQYEKIGEALKKANDAYEKASVKLTPGGQSIITTCNELIKLGAANSKTNPVPQIEQ